MGPLSERDLRPSFETNPVRRRWSGLCAAPRFWLQVRLQVQRQLAQALFKLSVEFRKEETRFLNKMEAQKGLAAGSSIGLVEDEGPGGAVTDPGFTETQLMKVRQRGLAARPRAL